MNPLFSARTSVEQVEEGLFLAPKFDCNGLIPVVTTDANTGEVLMHAYMNRTYAVPLYMAHKFVIFPKLPLQLVPLRKS